jgi:peptidoglycan/LPS O-acetylase OafA/YrhL
MIAAPVDKFLNLAEVSEMDRTLEPLTLPESHDSRQSVSRGSWLRRFAHEVRSQYDPLANLHAIISRPPHREPIIDGARAIAICWVISVHLILYHIGVFPQETLTLFRMPWLHLAARGDMGVDLFFVISGYLIGSLLLGEFAASGTIHVKRFYLRRFLRLIPVYTVAMVLALYFLHGLHAGRIWANLLYVNNFLPIDRQFMPWCWSLAIEEQFYILLPGLVLLLMRFQRIRWPWMCAFLVLAGATHWTVIHANRIVPPFTDMPGMPAYDWRLTIEYQNLYTRCGGLLIGFIGAYAVTFHKSSVRRIFTRTTAINLIGLCCLIAMLLIGLTSMGLPASSPTAGSSTPAFVLDAFFNRFAPALRQLWLAEHRDVFALCTLFLVLAGMFSPSLLGSLIRRVLSSPIWRPIAQLSYSLYLTHEMLLVWIIPRTVRHLGRFLGPYQLIAFDCVLSLCAMLVCSAALFALIEKPSMDMRSLPAIRELTSTGNDRK